MIKVARIVGGRGDSGKNSVSLKMPRRNGTNEREGLLPQSWV